MTSENFIIYIIINHVEIRGLNWFYIFLIPYFFPERETDRRTYGALFKYFRHVLRQRVCHQPIHIWSGARAIRVFKCENEDLDWLADAFQNFQITISGHSPFSGANNIKVSLAFSLKRNRVIGWQIAKSCYIARLWEGLWPWPEGSVTRYCGYVATS